MMEIQTLWIVSHRVVVCTLSSSQFWRCMKMCWSVQLLAAPVRAMLTATVTHTAGIHTSHYGVDLHLCLTLYSCKCEHCAPDVCSPFVYLQAPTIHTRMQDSGCVSGHQCDAELRSQQHAPLLIFIFIYAPPPLQSFRMPHRCCREAVKEPR